MNVGNQIPFSTKVTMDHPNHKDAGSHMPGNSIFFEKIVPALLIVMGIVTVGLILFAAGVLLGIIHF